MSINSKTVTYKGQTAEIRPTFIEAKTGITGRLKVWEVWLEGEYYAGPFRNTVAAIATAKRLIDGHSNIQ